ncbi:galactosyltransferase-related protein [Pedobacter aquatilis]|uniref:glycosyltransferase family 2 protein n=1 Tax=Pedobacter aquatilis TaxID=351343 RepID=UPI0025B32C6E|nr:galactosyltransferase-related protein [Pedobacter aquatilis]MDN3586233.1 galactosyltransferase-related protein [Pedobacter aquatilis]
MTKISVLTLVSGRTTALLNLLKGLNISTLAPDELIVVFMNEQPKPLPEMAFPVFCFEINADGHLPLSGARNLACLKASGDLLIFLDVDCIPSNDLIANYRAACSADCLLSGKVRYLKNMNGQPLPSLNDLIAFSKVDPIRKHLKEISYELFWSLNFACLKTTYQNIGGFDELFEGYGGEDTDFAFSAKEKQIPIKLVEALAFHQHHQSYSPPLNHLDDIIRNAQYFFKKWGSWPMSGWLEKFQQAGLISIKEGNINKLRSPSLEELKMARKP